MNAAAVVLGFAAAAIYLPHIIDRALRNRRARQQRAALVTIGAVLDELAEWADAFGGECEVYDHLVCEQIEKAEGWRL